MRSGIAHDRKIAMKCSGSLQRFVSSLGVAGTSMWCWILRFFKRFFQPRKLAEIWESDHLLPGSRAEHYRDFDQAVHALGAQLLDQVRPPLALKRWSHQQRYLVTRRLSKQRADSLDAGKVVSIIGLGGIGKSAMGATAVQQCKIKNVFWYTVQPTLTDHLSGLLYALGYFLHEQGASHLWSFMLAESGKSDNLNLLLGLVKEDIERLSVPPLLCFDELEHLRSAASEYVTLTHTQMLRFIDALRGAMPLIFINQRPVLEADVTIEPVGLGPMQIGQLWRQSGLTLTRNDISAPCRLYKRQSTLASALRCPASEGCQPGRYARADLSLVVAAAGVKPALASFGCRRTPRAPATLNLSDSSASRWLGR